MARAPRELGFWSVLLEDLSAVADLGATAVFHAARSPSELTQYLEAARNAGLRVLVSLVPHESAVDQQCLRAGGDDGCAFDLAAFTAALEPYAGTLGEYRDVIAAHVLFDEPFDPTNWGGVPMSWETIAAAAAASRERLPFPVAVNVGTLRQPVPPGVLDLVLLTFYANKERREGPLESYLASQAEFLPGDGRPGIVLLLQGFGDARSPFPTPEELRARGEAACRHDDVRAVFWWTWSKPGIVDFRSVLEGPSSSAYAAAVRAVAAACAAES